jgi:hypothetical protein
VLPLTTCIVVYRRIFLVHACWRFLQLG